MNPATTLVYRPDIDGLRCIAVTAVIAYHLDPTHFRGGFLGVDVFFVISGFLISSLLYREISESGTISFAHFWLRRAKRILPALLCMLAGTALLVQLLFGKTTLVVPFAKSLVAAIFSLSNFVFFFESGYFSAAAETKPLLHTWSLGVEEQFYLFFPCLLFAALVRLRMRKSRFFAGLCACTLVSWATCIIAGQHAEDFAFFMLPTRLWEMLSGSALAFAHTAGRLPRLPERAYALIETAAFALMLFCLFTAKREVGLWNTIIVLAVLPLLYPQTGSVSRLFSLKLFTGIGKISYSLYLWHWPFIALATLYFLELPDAFKAGIVALSVVCACASYFLVEVPCRMRTRGWPQAAGYLAPAGALLCAVGVTWMLFPPASRLIVPPPSSPMTLGPVLESVLGVPLLRIGPEGKASFLLCGDSHAHSLAPVFAQLAEEYSVSGRVLASGGMFIHPDYQGAASVFKGNDQRARRVDEYIREQEIKTVIVAARWNPFLHGDSWEGRQQFVYRGAPVTDPRAIAGRLLGERLLEWLDAGIDVYIVEQTPEHPYKFIERAAVLRNGSPAADHDRRGLALREIIASIKRPNLHFVPTGIPFRQGDEYILVQNATLLYSDHTHLNVVGAGLLHDTFAPLFKRLQAAHAGSQGAVPH